MEKTNKRLANLDLLKVVSMMMIVCLHYLRHGGVLDKATLSDGNYYVAWLFEMLCIIGVNCFILCSGYLMAGSRFKFSKLVYLWLQMVFIGIVCIIIALLVNDEKIGIAGVVNVILPINRQSYWYLSAYFAFYFISPLLIWIENRLTVNQLKKLVMVLVIVFSLSPFQWTNIQNGYHVVWFCVLFFVAAYIRRADLFKKESKVYFCDYLLLSLLMFVIHIVVQLLSVKTKHVSIFDISGYNNIFVLASSLLLFVAFKNLTIKSVRMSRFFTFISALTLGVYLIHENEFIRPLLWKRVIAPVNMFDKPYFVLHMLVSVLAVFFICAFLEYFRQLLFKLFGVPALCEKIGARLQKLADKLFADNTIEKL